MTDQHSNAQSPQFTEAELAYVSSLFDAARNGDTQLLSSALDAGVPVNLTNSKGDTLLNLAAYLEREETVSAPRGADARVRAMGPYRWGMDAPTGTSARRPTGLEQGQEQETGAFHGFSCLSMAAAARRPSPMARITVAPPRTMSPPA